MPEAPAPPALPLAASATTAATAATAVAARPGEPAPEPARWQVRLLGSVDASDGARTLQRFPSRAVAALLARIALAPQRAHAREELIELLWPGVELAVGRNRLRQALSTLKALLEDGAGAPGRVAGPVLLADRLHVRAVPGAIASDAHEFERLARAGHAAQARALYRGEFMPGFYDEWIEETRLALAAIDERLAAQLARSPAGAAAAPGAAPASGASAATPASARALAPAAALAALAGSTAPTAPIAPAAPAAALATRTRLPHYLSRLFGAEAHLAALARQVLEYRLVTVVGPGGSGKTRLAVEAAHALAQGPAAEAARFDLVAFVPLAACASREQALDAVFGALRLGAAGGDAVAAVADALRGRRVLLVLDNLEQLVEAARDAIAHWLAELPGLHVLATSRRPLVLDGEREFAAAALPLPPAGATLAEAAANPAVALFVERARAARADFHLGERNAPVLAALVRALEGMPLALELAASRVRSIAPAEMLERLRGPGAPRLELLARSGPRGAFDARHASMQRVIAWSWELLPAAHRGLLAALTLFPAGFAAAAAAALALANDGAASRVSAAYGANGGNGASGADGADGADGASGANGANGANTTPAAAGATDTTGGTGAFGTAAQQLDDLVAHSLLTARADGAGAMRFVMYEPIREFAALTLAPAERLRARAGLRRWARQWAAALPATPVLEQVREEMPNLVAALGSAVDDGVPKEAIELLLALRRCLEDVELPAEGLAHARRAADAAAAEHPVLAARGLSTIGPLLYTAGQAEAALAAAERGLACAALDPRQRARALHAVARVRWRSRNGVEQVEPMLAEAERLLGQVAARTVPGTVPGTGEGGGGRGGDGPGVEVEGPNADPDLEQRASLAALRAFVANREHRRHAEAERLHAQALALWERGGNRHAIDSGRYNLAVCAQAAGRNEQALERLAPVIASARALGDWHRLSQALNVRGNALSSLRQWAAAVGDYRQCIDVAWRHMSDYDLAYGLWNLPRALVHVRRAEEGVTLAAYADQFWRERFGALCAQDERDLLRVRRLAARLLPPQAIGQHWASGAALGKAEAVALALA